MSIEWNPETREFHLQNDRISYVMRVLENGWLGHLYFGTRLTPGRSYAHLVPGEFLGFSNRVGDPCRVHCGQKEAGPPRHTSRPLRP